MQIVCNGSSELTITGNIKSIEDSIAIKQAIVRARREGAESLRLNILDSFSITSTVIGNLMKLVHHDKVSLSLMVGDQRLYELLAELNLAQTFNVRFVKR